MGVRGLLGGVHGETAGDGLTRFSEEPWPRRRMRGAAVLAGWANVALRGARKPGERDRCRTAQRDRSHRAAAGGGTGDHGGIPDEPAEGPGTGRGAEGVEGWGGEGGVRGERQSLRWLSQGLLTLTRTPPRALCALVLHNFWSKYG